MFLNESGIIGVALISFTNNVTGSLFLTLLTIVGLLMMVCFLFRIPVEFSAIIVLPLLIVLMAYSSQFLAVGGVILIYLGVLFGRYFIINFR
jgi:hypothetical protein